MPATYFSFFSQKKYSDKFIYSDDLKLKLQKISAVIKNRENHRECGLGLLSLINRLKVRKDNEPNKKFHIDEGCIRCGYCVMVCPMKNIRIVNSKIIFSNNCNTCFACVHYCSQGVLQYGNRTEGKQRYRHPSISIGDLMVQKR